MLKVRQVFVAALLAPVSLSLSTSATLWAQEAATGAQSSALSKLGQPKVCRCNGWIVAETANFWVCCYDKELPAADIAAHCEDLRRELSEKWLAARTATAWSIKCMVVLHPTQASYLAAVGQDTGATAGSSLVETLHRNVAKRRIDLRGDRPDYLTAALPHELTHVLLADHFAGRSLPRWADEGMAILADTQAKRDLHARDLSIARANVKTVALAKFLPDCGYPSADRWGAFYGESVSVVDYLVARGTPHKFVQFLDAAQSEGYDHALMDFYGIQDGRELDRLWASSLDKSAANLASNP